MKIHFVGKSFWVMPNSNGVKQRLLVCFLKILDKKRKKWRELLADQYISYRHPFSTVCFTLWAVQRQRPVCCGNNVKRSCMYQWQWNAIANRKKWNLYIHIMFTEHSITHLLQLPALSFPRVIIISPFLKTIYNKVAVHLYVFTFVETIFNLKNGVLLIQLTSELHTNILIITRGSQEPETLNWISWATTIV